MHLTAPEETKRPFHKAIVQIGACVFRLRNVEDRKGFGAAVAEKAGCTDAATALQCMRGKDHFVVVLGRERLSGLHLTRVKRRRVQMNDATAWVTGSGVICRGTIY